MPFAAAISTSPDTDRALDEVCTLTRAKIGERPDLALLFFSPHHADAAGRLAKEAGRRLEARCLLGCQGESIVGNDQEVEGLPAVCLWLGHWTQPVEPEPGHLVLEQTPDGFSLLGWPDGLLTADPAESLLLVLGDPFTFPVEDALRQVEESNRGLRAVGGMASGSGGPGETRLILGDKVVQEGAVAVLLRGPVKARTIVSQGCRPIGKPMVVTKAQDNLLAELGGRPAFDRLKELWPELSSRDQMLVQNGLHLGRAVSEFRDEFGRGDFLVRNVLGFDRNSGAIGINDRVRVGQTVQFHVRDAETADEDLRDLLRMDRQAQANPPGGALLFTCNGRGSRLFPEPHHDAKAIRQEVGDVPVAGFFAAGELGPVGRENFIHGFTASVVLFE